MTDWSPGEAVASINNINDIYINLPLNITHNINHYNQLTVAIFIIMHVIDARKTDALNQWCLWKLLWIKWYQQCPPCMEWWCETDNRVTTSFSYCPSTASLSVLPHCMNARWNRCQEDLSNFPLENWRSPPGRPRTTCTKTIQQNLKSNNLPLNETIKMDQNCPLSKCGKTHS